MSIRRLLERVVVRSLSYGFLVIMLQYVHNDKQLFFLYYHKSAISDGFRDRLRLCIFYGLRQFSRWGALVQLPSVVCVALLGESFRPG